MRLIYILSFILCLQCLLLKKTEKSTNIDKKDGQNDTNTGTANLTKISKKNGQNDANKGNEKSTNVVLDKKDQQNDDNKGTESSTKRTKIDANNGAENSTNHRMKDGQNDANKGAENSIKSKKKDTPNDAKNVTFDDPTKCVGNGRSSCKSGEFCREGVCRRVRLSPSGCSKDADCKEGYQCYSRNCVRKASPEELELLKKRHTMVQEILNKKYPGEF